MAENSKNTKLLSYVLLAAGIAGLAFALVLDFSGSSASYRGPLLVIGAVVFLVGLYFFPTVEHHRSIINFIFRDSSYPVRPGYYLLIYGLERNQTDRGCRIRQLCNDV